MEIKKRIAATNPAYITEKSGKAFVVHPVKITDSLTSIGLMYNVSSHLIKQVNELVSDQIYSKKELLVPVVDGMRLPSFIAAETEEEKDARLLKESMYLQNVQRASAVRIMATLIAEHHKPEPRSKFFTEAKFYLEEAGYDLAQAQAKFLADVAWEQQQKKDAPKKPGFFAKLFGLSDAKTE